MKNKKKQTRPLFIPKPESGDFPFDIQDVDAPEGKRIDYFRMYNCMKMVVEKLVTDQTVAGKVLSNIDQIYRVFIEKDHNPPQPQKMVGRRNSPHTYQKEEFWNYIEHLNTMGFSYKQISEKLQVHYVQISTHHRNSVNYEDSEEELESLPQKKPKAEYNSNQQQEAQEESQLVSEHDVFYSDDDKK